MASYSYDAIINSQIITFGSYETDDNDTIAYSLVGIDATSEYSTTAGAAETNDEVYSGSGTVTLSGTATTLRVGYGEITFGTESQFDSASTSYIDVAWLDSTHFVVSGSTGIKIGLVSGSSISYGTEVAFSYTSKSAISVLDSSHFAIAYGYTSSYDSFAYTTIYSVSGTTISTVDSLQVDTTTPSGGGNKGAAIYDFDLVALSSTRYIVSYSIMSYWQIIFPPSYPAIRKTYSAIIDFDTPDLTKTSSASFFNLNITECRVEKLDTDKFIVIYTDDSNLYSKVATISSDTISYGSQYTINTLSTDISVIPLDSTHVVFTYRDSGNSSYGTSRVGVISGTTITLGDEYVFNSTTTDYIDSAYVDEDRYFISFKDDGGDDYGISIVGTITNGDEITFGSEYTFNSAVTSYIAVDAYDSESLLTAYNDTTGKVIIGSISDAPETAHLTYSGSGTISISGAATILKTYSFTFTPSGTITISGAPSYEATYSYYFSALGTTTLSGIATTIESYFYSYSGTGTISISGTSTTIESNDYEYSGTGTTTLSGDATTTEGVNYYEYSASGNITISGAANYVEVNRYFYTAPSGPHIFTTGSATTIESNDYEYSGSGTISISGIANYSGFNNYIYQSSGVIYTSGTASIEIDYEYSGLGNISTNGTGTIEIGIEYPGSGGTVISGSATLSIDKFYTPTGSVSLSGTATTEREGYGEITFGDRYQLSTDASGRGHVIVLDSSTLISFNAYNYTATVGTVSGTTISFGSDYEFDTSTVGFIDALRIDDTHFIFTYTNSSTVGYAVIGTVSGTTISFGTKQTISSLAQYCTLSQIDSNNYIITYFYTSGSIKAVHASVSGTTISIGTAYTASTSGTDYVSLTSKILDSTHFITCYRDVDNAKGSSMVGTISGTTISWGSEYYFNSTWANDNAIAVLDSTHFIVSYRDGDGGGNTSLGTISSGNVITFETEVEYVSTLSIFNDNISLDDDVIVTVFGDYNNTNLSARKGTISGTTLTYDSAVTLDTEKVYYIYADNFDSSKFVVQYSNPDNGDYTYLRIAELSSAPDLLHVEYTGSGTINLSGEVFGRRLPLGFRTETTFNAYTQTSEAGIDARNGTQFVLSYPGSSSDGYNRLGTVINSTISLSSTFEFRPSDIEYSDVSFIDDDRFLQAFSYYSAVDSLYKHYIYINSIDESNVITNLSGALVGNGTFNVVEKTQIYVNALSSTKFIVSTSVGFNLYHRLFEINGDNSVTLLDYITDNTESGYYYSLSKLDESNLLVAYSHTSGTDTGYSRVLTVSGSTLSLGTPSSFDADASSSIANTAISATKALISYNKTDGNAYSVIATISGTSVSYGTPKLFNTGSVDYLSSTKLTSDRLILTYQDSDTKGKALSIIINGSNISFGDEYTFSDEETYYIRTRALNTNDFVVSYRDATNDDGEVILGYLIDPYNIEYTGSGATTLSGSALIAFEFVYSPSGSTTLSGAAPTEIGYEYSGSGNISTNGTASIVYGIEYSGSGEIVLSGSLVGIESNDYLVTGSGTITLSGIAPEVAYVMFENYTGSGNIIVASAAITSLTNIALGRGTITLSGTATTLLDTRNFLYSGSGDIAVSGAANYVEINQYYYHAPSGPHIFTTGDATTLISTRHYEYSTTGDIILSGDATTWESNDYENYTGLGSISTSGNATTLESNDYPFTGSGDITTSGTATLYIDKFYYPTGTVVISGTITSYEGVNYFEYTPEGTIEVSGDIITENYYRYPNFTGAGNIRVFADAIETINYAFIGSGQISTSGAALGYTDSQVKKIIRVKSLMNRTFRVESLMNKIIRVSSKI